MQLSWATDEISTYLQIPAGFVIDINGRSYTVVSQSDEGLCVREWTEETEGLTGPETFIEYWDIRTLHIN